MYDFVFVLTKSLTQFLKQSAKITKYVMRGTLLNKKNI